MRRRTFSFMKCCEWLYLGALSAGILVVLYGFFGENLAWIFTFSEVKNLFGFLFLRQREHYAVFWNYVGVAAAGIASAAVVYTIRQFPVLKGVLVLWQAVSLVALAVLGKSLPGWCVCIIFIAALLFLAEFTAKGRKEVLGLFPLFLAALVLLCLIPRPENPLDWSFAKSTYTFVKEKAEMLALDIAYLFEGENNFSFASTGYGNSGGLGGAVSDDDREQVHIIGNTRNPLYLTGAVYERYTGKGWKTEVQKREEINAEAEGMLNSLQKSIYAAQADSLTGSSLITVEYRFIKTADFFHDLHTTNLYFAEKEAQFKKNVPWRLTRARGKDFTYQLRFLEIHEKSDEIKEFLRGRAWKEDAVWEETTPDKAYTELPEAIPERVYELAHSLSAGTDNDYDRMQAFVNYLKEYTYTKTPPECPKGSEFTDYFLFESKSGYCTYFATALAVLGRCEGIPTRYVKGFVTTDTCKGTGAEVELSGNQAHAWTEAYIEHVGWVRYDATPGYGESLAGRENGWKPIEFTGGSTLGDVDNHDKIPKPDDSQEEEEVPETPGRPVQWYAKMILESIAVCMVSAAVLLGACVWIKNAVRRRKYECMNAQEKIYVQIKRLLRLGKLQGVPLSEEKTLEAYAGQLKECLDTGDYTFIQACVLYEKIRFGAKTASLEEIRELEMYTKSVERTYLANCGFLKKLVYQIVKK